ncbi:MAG: NAD(P)-dependent oxidoreductase [bacterium]|nr:NAD(P)-dependent oxidoreductase [bacterium]
MKYIILGANGLIGQQFVRQCRAKGIEYVGTCYSRNDGTLIPFNQLDFERIVEVFNEEKPAVVINAIGLAGGVNFCQDNPETGRKYHVEATKIMTDWCRENDAAQVYISTDYVFDGKNPPYKEEAKTNPLNLYGALKLEGEQYIAANRERYVIARTTNVFGWDPETQTPNFLMHLMETLKTQNRMKVPSFLYGNPTYVGDLAAGIMDLLEKEKYGMYHLVGPGYISRYDWAVKCIEMAGLKGKTIEKLEKPPEGMVPRPLQSNLDTSKFRKVSEIKFHDIDEGLQIFVNEMKR